MAKVLISSVGTGFKAKDSKSEYESTIYTIDGKDYENKQLVSKVIVEHFDIEKIIFIGTKKSRWDNYCYYFNEMDETYETLEKKIDNSSLEEKDLDVLEQVVRKSHKNIKEVHSFLIDYKENNQEEMWGNFYKLQQIENYLEKGDEVYLDMTHGFRYMPILNMLVLEFLSLEKENIFELKAILYGMLATTPQKSNIVDMKIFFDLLKWIRAINMFKHNSNADQLINLLKESDFEDKEVLTKTFSNFNNSLHIANMASIKQFITGAKSKIQKMKNSKNNIISFVYPQLEQIISRLDRDKLSHFQYELASWLYENKNYALSYMALAEAIVSKTCELKGLDTSSQDDRNQAKRRIDAPYNKYYNETIGTEKNKNANISDIRNNIAHQLRDRKNMVNQDIQSLEKFLITFKDYIYS